MVMQLFVFYILASNGHVSAIDVEPAGTDSRAQCTVEGDKLARIATAQTGNTVVSHCLNQPTFTMIYPQWQRQYDCMPGGASVTLVCSAVRDVQ